MFQQLKFIKTNVFLQNCSVSENWHFLRHDAPRGYPCQPREGYSPSLLPAAAPSAGSPCCPVRPWQHTQLSSGDQVKVWHQTWICTSTGVITHLPLSQCFICILYLFHHQNSVTGQRSKERSLQETCKSQTPAYTWMGFTDCETGKLHCKDITAATEGTFTGCEQSYTGPGMQLLLLWLHAKRCLAHSQLQLCIGRQAQVCLCSSGQTWVTCWGQSHSLVHKQSPSGHSKPHQLKEKRLKPYQELSRGWVKRNADIHLCCQCWLPQEAGIAPNSHRLPPNYTGLLKSKGRNAIFSSHCLFPAQAI